MLITTRPAPEVHGAPLTVPAEAPEPFSYEYAFTTLEPGPLESWSQLLTLLTKVGQDRRHAYLFVGQVNGNRSVQCIGNARQNRIAVEVSRYPQPVNAVVRTTRTGATGTATCAVSAIIRHGLGGRFDSLRSYVLTAPEHYFLGVLEAGHAIQHWLGSGSMPAGLHLTTNVLP